MHHATRCHRPLGGLAGVVWACAAAALPAAAQTVYDAAAVPTAGGVVTFGLRSDHHADPVSLALMGHGHWNSRDWAQVAPRRGDNLARIDDEARLGWRQHGGAWHGWQLALLARSQATLVASHDALALAAQLARGEPQAADAHWNTRVRLRAFSGAGLAVGREQALTGLPLPGRWQAAWEMQGLVLGSWRERHIAGPVHLDASSQRYDFALGSSEAYNRLRLPFQQPAARRGAGLLLAAQLDWQGEGPGRSQPGQPGDWAPWARLSLRDGGWLRWRGMPQQQATLDTATASTDADGFLVYEPLIQGQNRQTTLTRWMPWRASLAGGVTWADGQRWGVRLDSEPGWGVLPAFTWQWPAAAAQATGWAGLGWQAEWRVHERRLGLGLDWRGLSLRLGADRLGSGARSREWALAWRQGF
ncbi:hypothetical protein [Aquabacterium sp. OR-4]|uniref:hypothetical protein n=1 Tax=Aquabacterium sp. OR-4 TaxID=2978127 RepID=UPI0021B49632|nr:hypothetical protein [Aquabacterium sp. OR-4]MDT7833887.1 hypothetical protein [Aquabacterium sp. OR-4]